MTALYILFIPGIKQVSLSTFLYTSYNVVQKIITLDHLAVITIITL